MSAIYTTNTEFEAAKTKLAQCVHPRRWQALHLLVHDRAATAPDLEPMKIAREYIEFLQLRTEQLPYLCDVPQHVAANICETVAEFEVVMCGRQMSHDVSVQLASAWLERFRGNTVFWINGNIPASTPRKKYFDYLSYGLFFTDREAGVLAASATRAGLFWAAENS